MHKITTILIDTACAVTALTLLICPVMWSALMGETIEFPVTSCAIPSLQAIEQIQSTMLIYFSTSLKLHTYFELTSTINQSFIPNLSELLVINEIKENCDLEVIIMMFI